MAHFEAAGTGGVAQRAQQLVVHKEGMGMGRECVVQHIFGAMSTGDVAQ